MPDAVIRLELAPVSISAQRLRVHQHLYHQRCPHRCGGRNDRVGTNHGRNRSPHPWTSNSVIRCAGEVDVEVERREEIAAEQAGERSAGTSFIGNGPTVTLDHHQGSATQEGIAKPEGAQGVRPLLDAAKTADRRCHPPVALQVEAANSVLAHQRAFGAGVEDERRGHVVDLHRHQQVAVDDVHRHHAALFHPALGERQGRRRCTEQRALVAMAVGEVFTPPRATRQPLFLGFLSVGMLGFASPDRRCGLAMVPSGARSSLPRCARPTSTGVAVEAPPGPNVPGAPLTTLSVAFPSSPPFFAPEIWHRSHRRAVATVV